MTVIFGSVGKVIDDIHTSKLMQDWVSYPPLKKLDVVKKVLALIPPLCYRVISRELPHAPTLYNRGIYFLDVSRQGCASNTKRRIR